MTRSRSCISALLAWLLSGSLLACAGSTAKPTPEQEERRAEAIREYFANRELEPVEGLWALEHCDLAVVKRIGADGEKEYLGIVTSPDCRLSGRWTPDRYDAAGDLLLTFKQESSEDRFAGRFNNQRQLSVLLEGRRLIISSESIVYDGVSGLGAERNKLIFSRVYPPK